MELCQRAKRKKKTYILTHSQFNMLSSGFCGCKCAKMLEIVNYEAVLSTHNNYNVLEYELNICM